MLIKTYENWEGNLDDYLNVGDIVDEAMVDHFLNVLPPIVATSSFVQSSGACDFINGKSTFTTFIKQNGNWIYVGECHARQCIKPLRIVKTIKEYHIAEVFANKVDSDGNYGDIYIDDELVNRYHHGSEVLKGYGVFSNIGVVIADSCDFYDTIEEAETFINSL